MNFHFINPLADPRWDALAGRHPRACAFHQRGWLQALARTYGYEPLALTSASEGEALQDGMVFCRVASWITGTRLVSLPFTDHCHPLLSQAGEAAEFMNWLGAESGRRGWKYVELRPLSTLSCPASGWRAGQTYAFHQLDLAPGLEQIFRGLHKNSIQRKVQRAEREGLVYDSGRSAQMVDEFYRLVLMTRRRQLLLPQPRRWFQNLAESMGESLQIRLARKTDGAAIAAILTLRHGATAIYKYGCSDEKFHNLGGMPFLFWRLIEESKAAGAAQIDFGRSDLDNPGLITFKDRLGAKRSALTYQRYPARAADAAARWNSQTLRRFISILPDAVLCSSANLLYKHVG